MKKSLLAVAAMTAFAGAAQAQSSVTVYGILDVGFVGSHYNGTSGTAGSVNNVGSASAVGGPTVNAGSAGFGTVRSGATERANVDLTQELVDLITEQRNFQANAKAMETSTSMTNTIIQIRN